ncbi:hypothetical protein O181_045961 [Austropuccinia psidii MF-1]|uniref:Uncharacterized protein n=1 Tax=Austropuccinia psidii MF-1 TaxID=1389203 RepID=A0A9Q3HI74_9BASI|nr:hypothetical protein [Austropuccinia psidii MF-1]
MNKMRRNLDMDIEEPEKWLANELSGMNEEDEGEIPQKEFKINLNPPEANYSGITEDYVRKKAGTLVTLKNIELMQNQEMTPLSHWKKEMLENWKMKVP